MSDVNGSHGGHNPAGDQEAIEALTLVIAHLAAQLTMAQIRLRGLASALESAGTLDPALVRGHVTEIADRETGHYLAENLGEKLTTLIDVDQLTRDIIQFVSAEDHS